MHVRAKTNRRMRVRAEEEEGTVAGADERDKERE